MEEVHPAVGNGESVFGTEFARGADGVPPVELGVRPVAEPDFLFGEADQLAGFARDDDAPACKLPPPSLIPDDDEVAVEGLRFER